MERMKKLLIQATKFSLICLVLLCLSLLSALITMKLVSKTDLVKVPSVEGKDTVYALEQLNKIGLRLKISGQAFSDSIPEDHIIEQDPKPQSLIRRDRAVKVTLSKGSEKVDVPNVVDEPWLRAQGIVQDAGLTVGRLVRTYHEETGKNRVIAQNPPGNSIIHRDHAIDLLLSEGKRPSGFYMPGLQGIPIDSAVSQLKESGLFPGKVTYKYSSSMPPNTVIAQRPQFGYRVFSNEKIDLEVSKGEKFDQEEEGIYTTLSYRVPAGIEDREVKILLQSGEESREIFRRILPPGEEVELLIKTTRNTRAQIYLDDELIEERQF